MDQTVVEQPQSIGIDKCEVFNHNGFMDGSQVATNNKCNSFLSCFKKYFCFICECNCEDCEGCDECDCDCSACWVPVENETKSQIE
jgi:hypothetical protein